MGSHWEIWGKRDVAGSMFFKRSVCLPGKEWILSYQDHYGSGWSWFQSVKMVLPKKTEEMQMEENMTQHNLLIKWELTISNSQDHRV